MQGARAQRIGVRLDFGSADSGREAVLLGHGGAEGIADARYRRVGTGSFGRNAKSANVCFLTCDGQQQGGKNCERN